MKRLMGILALAVASACGGRAPETPRSSGYVEATDVRVSAKVAGRVTEVAVREGERATAGQTVVKLATTDLDLQKARLVAERAHADAQVRLLLAGSRKEDVNQAAAQVAAAEAELTAARAELDAAVADVARFTKLVEARAGATKPRDDAEARRRVAAARVHALEERVSAARATHAKVAAGSRVEEVDAARARRTAVDAQIASLDEQIAEATIHAPIEGIVGTRLVEPGELVAAGAPVLVILDLDRAWVSAFVDEPLVGTVRVDQPATITTDAGQQLTGRVAFIAPRAEFTPRNVQTASERARLVYRVKVTVDNREGVLKPGMPVEVTWR